MSQLETTYNTTLKRPLAASVPSWWVPLGLILLVCFILDRLYEYSIKKQSKTNPDQHKEKVWNSFHNHGIIALGIIGSHIVGVYTLICYRDVSTSFYVGAVVAGFLNMLGVTAGYHRLWSHKSFSASLPLRILLSVMGACSWQGSIKWWVLRHRMHHRFTDTQWDPYDATKGLWFSHFGWLFEKPQFYGKKNIIDMSDLEKDPVVAWNTKMTAPGLIVLGIFLPLAIGHVMGDSLGGLLWIGVMGRIISWNGIFSVNSFAHWCGDRYYNVHSTAAGNFILGVLSNGESGGHNYHHEFPKDYRHGEWYNWDPSKWFIWSCSKLGLAWDLQTTDPHIRKQTLLNELVKMRRQEYDSSEKLLTTHLSTVDKTSIHPLPRPVSELPTITMAEFLSLKASPQPIQRLHSLLPDEKREAGEKYTHLRRRRKAPLSSQDSKDGYFVKIDEFLIDVTEFREIHPGGEDLIKRYNWTDATKVFHGGRNIHTKSAQYIAARLRVAKIVAE